MGVLSRARQWSLRSKVAAACVLVLAGGAAGQHALGRQALADRLMRADPNAILDDAPLAAYALDIGRAGFARHCASCHGAGRGDPTRGVPDLTDGEFLYGQGQVAEIETIVLHGIRSGDPRGWNLADMPAYARARPYAREPIPPLLPAQIADVVQYLQQLHGKAPDDAAAARGKALFKGNGGCWDCHGQDAGGDAAIGAPNLLDDVWLYGDGSPGAIAASIANGRGGISPAFARKLTPVEVRAIAVYAASLSTNHAKDARHD